jgi:hypothetical protein
VLSAAYLPPADMVRYRWFQPVRGGWYYFDPTPRIIPPTPPIALDDVDPLIRPIIACLHRRSIPTYPSCQGHFVTREEFEALYSQLLLDAEQIRTEGLPLLEMATDTLWRYRDAAYTPPDKETLWADIRRYRGCGFVMFRARHIAPERLEALHALLVGLGAQCRITAKREADTAVQLDVVTTPDNQARVWGAAARWFEALTA